MTKRRNFVLCFVALVCIFCASAGAFLLTPSVQTKLGLQNKFQNLDAWDLTGHNTTKWWDLTGLKNGELTDNVFDFYVKLTSGYDTSHHLAWYFKISGIPSGKSMQFGIYGGGTRNWAGWNGHANCSLSFSNIRLYTDFSSLATVKIVSSDQTYVRWYENDDTQVWVPSGNVDEGSSGYWETVIGPKHQAWIDAGSGKTVFNQSMDTDGSIWTQKSFSGSHGGDSSTSSAMYVYIDFTTYPAYIDSSSMTETAQSKNHLNIKLNTVSKGGLGKSESTPSYYTVDKKKFWN